MAGISIWSLLLIFAIVLLLFGTKKLKNIGGDLGVHSQFFNVLQELGLLGLISVLSIYVVFIMYCRQFIPANKGLAIAGLFLALSFIDFGLVESIWGINNAGVFFTVMMALIAGQLAYEQKNYQ